MAGDDGYMDETCAWLGRLVEHVQRQPLCPIHFAGTGSSFGNLPSPLLEMFWLMENDIPDLAMGPLHTQVRANQFGLVNVHYGNVAPPGCTFKSMCVFLDVSDDPQFDSLAHAPLALIADVRQPARVARAFEHVISRCTATAWTPPMYQRAPRLRQRTAGLNRDTLTTRDTLATRATQTLLKAALLELLGTLMEEITTSRHTGPSGALPPGLGQAVALMHRQYHTPTLDRTDMARAAAMHPDHFTRQFKTHLRVTPMQYLAQLRISQAMFLLTHTHQRISQIALQVGFDDALHFSRVFRQHTRKSPRAYRGLSHKN